MEPLDKSKFNLGYLIKGDGMKDYYKSWGLGFRLVVTLALLFAIVFTVYSFFPKKKQATSSTTIGDVKEGATLNVTNINNPLQDLKQGIYGRLASDRGSIGVFKEMAPNIDISIGAGKDWDENEFIEVETRYKF